MSKCGPVGASAWAWRFPGRECECQNISNRKPDVYQIMAAGPSLLAAKPHHGVVSLDTPADPLSIPSEAADDLTATNEPDLLANDQTWPTDEEMASTNGGPTGSEGRRVKRVPKGTSAYQAAWIFDDDVEEGDDDAVEDGEMEVENGVAEASPKSGEDEETEEMELDSKRGDTHRDLDPEQEDAEYVSPVC